MTAQVIPFDFEAKSIRVVMRADEPWFVAADVCAALALTNPRQAISRLDDDEKTTVANDDGRPGQGAQVFNLINESGLYALVLKSRKPEAKRFRKWVTSVVLPSIRRTGRFDIKAPADLQETPPPVQTITVSDETIVFSMPIERYVRRLLNIRDKLTEENASLKDKVIDLYGRLLDKEDRS